MFAKPTWIACAPARRIGAPLPASVNGGFAVLSDPTGGAGGPGSEALPKPNVMRSASGPDVIATEVNRSDGSVALWASTAQAVPCAEADAPGPVVGWMECAGDGLRGAVRVGVAVAVAVAVGVDEASADEGIAEVDGDRVAPADAAAPNDARDGAPAHPESR